MVVVEVRGHCHIHGQSYGEGTVWLCLLIEDGQFGLGERREQYSDPLNLGCVPILEDLVKVVRHLLDLMVCKQQRKATWLSGSDMEVQLQYGALSSQSTAALLGHASNIPGASGRHAPRLATLVTWRVGTAA